MTNDELKKKIVDVLIKVDEYVRNEIIKATEEHKAFLTGDNQYYYIVADALIEAGIGDVTEWKEKAKKHRVQVLPDGTIKQLYSDEEVEDIARQRDEYKHRAEVAERALCNALNDDSCYFCNKKSPCECEHRDWGSKECITVLLRQAEKELAEEERK